jgi:hypothetical protein
MRAKLLRIYIGESGRYEGKPAYQAIIEFLRRKGIAGATVFRGFEGYGVHSILHTASILVMDTRLNFFQKRLILTFGIIILNHAYTIRGRNGSTPCQNSHTRVP